MLLDATAIPEDRGGVGRYVEDLLPALVAIGVPVTVLCQERDEAAFLATGAATITAPRWTTRRPLRLLWEQFGVTSAARRTGARVIHSVHYTFPLISRHPRVVSVHDLTFFTHPEVHTRVKRAFFGSWIRLAGALRLAVVVPSRATGEEYVRITRADRRSVSVAPHGHDPEMFHPPTEAEVRAFRDDHAVAASWIAFLGTIEPRKNVQALVTGFERAFADDPDAPALLLAGGPGWGDPIDPQVDHARARGLDVRRLGYLPAEQLRAFLAGATVVAYPSLGEGFGLPVLEAMAAGACVLTTRALALPEVGGDAVAYTGTDPESIAAALRDLVSSQARREELRRLGVERAAHFTWADAARLHAEAYASAARAR
ncbi:glycosyltransferase family 1 protein [Agromyces sp. Soil535]|uniref:glycosyltransferase family 4 protein n=1 Tax=Agromyces sp. Soil535 TaxID=1736390 RepID=UPI000AB009AD|nr:glycosyltransferase family 1 protein [Agromyces sp. Soil535]